jgi:3'-5' exoribonuclease
MKNIKEALSSKHKIGGTLPVQIGRVLSKTTAKGAPYLDIEIGDSTAVAGLKLWQDTQAFRVLKESGLGGGFFKLGGEFFKGDYGLECTDPRLEQMGALEVEEFLAGGEEGRKKTEVKMAYIDKLIQDMKVDTLRVFMADLLGKDAIRSRMARSAAARKNHHARRGGLLDHTVSMLKVAQAVAPCYPEAVPDLLFSGVICHDLGKVIENDTGEGFVPQLSVTGELLGHINVAIEMVNRQWKDSSASQPDIFRRDGADLVRQHLLHLIASHHGTKEWGSPVTPKTPEAILLHAIDNMDAKMEIISDVYNGSGTAEGGIFDGGRLMGGTAILPLTKSLGAAS